MATRIEISSKIFDTRAEIRRKKLAAINRKIKNIYLSDVYTLDKRFTKKELESISSMLSNPVTQIVTTGDIQPIPKKKNFAFAIEIGFLPGVTDNVAATAKESIEDLLKKKFKASEGVYTSQITFIDGRLSEKEILDIAESLYNSLIQRVHMKSFEAYKKDRGMNIIIPRVLLKKAPLVTTVNLEISDEELAGIGENGIANPDGSRRGPLALDLLFMKTIRSYFRKLGRSPTDIELESIAQTWSEHCKHTIFNDPIDELKDGLYKTYIKKATEQIRKKKSADAKAMADKGKKAIGDFCVSVFTDNSGGISFDDNFLITHKVETHNSPSALDPFGGAITGIVGVNRDTLGFGLGAKPVANFYGFCFANPKKDIPLYKTKSQKMLSSRRIMDGIIDGVNAGGNQSGIPTPQGFVYFDERYRGKPLVFVGTVGLLPKKIKNHPSHIKKAMPSDYIVMIGGRVGKDGIHGATFSSVALTSGSPATAVQIGDPITQKKLSDALVKEARDLLLYNSITDNGAGGLSCSVAEMAKESNGCLVDLEKVSLKYPGLDPWEIWISESQERMTLAVPKKNWKKFADLMNRRGVEATIIGEFTNSGKCIVTYNNKTIMDLDLQFLHDGLPKRAMATKEVRFKTEDIRIDESKDYKQTLIEMLKRLNIASFSFISEQFDHMVQANLALSPLVGRGKVNADATVIRPVLGSKKGIILSQGIYPSYSDIDTYHMAASCIDTAIRNAIAAGGNPEYLSLLDNFCWCSSNEPERLWQLKCAAKACYDYAVAYDTPFISGKDSMFNDFKGFDKNGKPINISIPPTLLISSFGVIDDVTKVVSIDAKFPGDLVYILGETHEELGGSEYLAMKNLVGNSIPKVNAEKNKKLYRAFHKAIQKNLISSSISIGRGGLGVALSKKAIGGMLGFDISLKKLPGTVRRDDFALYSESQGRILVSVAPGNVKEFEKELKGNTFAKIGIVTKEPNIIVKGLKKYKVINLDLKRAVRAYRETFYDF